jgi:AcrR family transcriptional regulator
MGKRRHYRQTRRATSAAETRGRIIAAARERLTAAPLHNVSLDEIAVRADVARSTIYTVFGSRAKLLDAVAEDVLTRGDFAALQNALSLPDAREALAAFVRESARLYATEHVVGRALLTLAAIDRDAVGAAQRLNAGRAESMAALGERLHEQHVLRPDVTPQVASDILWLLTSFETFDQLFAGRGLSACDAGERLLMLAQRALCQEPAPL